MKRLLLLGLALSLSVWSVSVHAQQDQTLADIRQELTFLYVEVQKLNRELSTTGSGGVNTAGNSVLDRVTAMESELQRLTAKTEELENRVNRIVSDGTRRIADLEFRLVELEGGDISTLGETTTLGGEQEAAAVTAPDTPAPSTDQASLAVGETADFNKAKDALDAGEYRTAADLFETFNRSYPGGPFAAEAELRRGEALGKLGDTREAARAFLASFSANPQGPMAPEALFELGRALGDLGQTQEACVTLGEIGVRFPQSPTIARAEDQRRLIGCT